MVKEISKFIPEIIPSYPPSLTREQEKIEQIKDLLRVLELQCIGMINNGIRSPHIIDAIIEAIYLELGIMSQTMSDDDASS